MCRQIFKHGKNGKVCRLLAQNCEGGSEKNVHKRVMKKRMES
jgi:hypothetical protein